MIGATTSKNTCRKRTTPRSPESSSTAASRFTTRRRLPGQSRARSRPRQLSQEEAGAHRERRRARRRDHGRVPENEGRSGQIASRLLLFPCREIRKARCLSLTPRPARRRRGRHRLRAPHEGSVFPRDRTCAHAARFCTKLDDRPRPDLVVWAELFSRHAVPARRRLFGIVLNASLGGLNKIGWTE
jgi:hypothetical protein